MAGFRITEPAIIQEVKMKYEYAQSLEIKTRPVNSADISAMTDLQKLAVSGNGKYAAEILAGISVESLTQEVTAVNDIAVEMAANERAISESERTLANLQAEAESVTNALAAGPEGQRGGSLSNSEKRKAYTAGLLADNPVYAETRDAIASAKQRQAELRNEYHARKSLRDLHLTLVKFVAALRA